ncbi:MAG: hypothetical protein JO338_00805 [Aquitalea sp.]|nr:hypothetical protein [Aquitalea sp.]
MLKLAGQYDLLVVEDNVSGDFMHGRQPTLAVIDGLCCVIYIDSCSKTLYLDCVWASCLPVR